MSTKRKRAAELAEPAETSTSTPGTAKKRKGRMPIREKEKQLAELEKAQFVIEYVKNYKNADNQSVIEEFLRAPSRRIDSEYYRVVSNPIDIARIQQKLKTEEYMTFDEFRVDVDLLISNALSYYKEDSKEHKQAKDLRVAYGEAKKKIETGEYKNESDEAPSPKKKVAQAEVDESRESSSSPGEVDVHMVHELLVGILERTDSTGRLLCPPFRVLQSKEEFPLYYEKIKEPIDLKKIAEKGRSGAYKKMQHLEDDLYLLFKNAQKFSGKGTEIYRDAEEMIKYVKEKAALVMEKGCHATRRGKVHRIVDGLLAQTPAAWASCDFSEDSEEDEDTENNDDPLWQLYWTIRNATNDHDRKITLADPFLELPNKSYYPDYFDEIKKPVSLFMINRKLKKGGYKFPALVADFMQMYANACEYNLDSSEVYIAAKKLERITLDTAQSLQPDIDLSEHEKKAPPLMTPSAKSKVMNKTTKIKMEDSDSDSRTPPPSMKRKSPKKVRENGLASRGRKTAEELAGMANFRASLMNLWDAVYKFKITGNDNYWPAGAFLDLPSIREYPEYYQVIKTPIDMKTIRERIESNKYGKISDVVDDFKQMFDNARQFNQPQSKIYQDANRLQAVLEAAHSGMNSDPASVGAGNVPQQIKFRNLSKTPKTPREKKPAAPRRSKVAHQSEDEDTQRIEIMISRLPEEEQKMWRLLQSIKDHRDENGRRVAINFMRLPTREEFPPYYDVIKKPMDLMRIQQRLQAQGYHVMSEIVADFTLMLSNACKFNEPESDIYKDAITLQRVLLDVKQGMRSDENVPRVQVELRSIFITIFAAVFGKKDECGKCLSDLFVELPDLLKATECPTSDWPFSFDQIKRNIDKCRYRRLDRLQKDFFDLFEKAREVSKVGSTIFNASVQLQKAFIAERDARCKGVIVSNAFAVLEKDIDEMVEKDTLRRASKEEDDDEKMENTTVKVKEGEVQLEEIEVDGCKYNAPCYAYISRTDEKKLPNHIFRVERIFKNENGDDAIAGFWVYRPNETMHLASRKFFSNEVFITPFQDTVVADRLRGKCIVVSVGTFVNKQIDCFEKKDVYMCESKYCGKPKYFVKMKTWPYVEEDNELKCTDRERPLSPQRSVTEVLAEENTADEDVCRSEEDTSSDEEEERARAVLVLDIERQETTTSSKFDENTEGRVYFQQIRSATGRFFCIGQFVLVFNPKKPLCDVMRIDRLWRDKEGGEFFSGCWFARPNDVIYDKGRMFYRKEVIAVKQDDQTHLLSDIQTRCEVMIPKDYMKQRPTEIAECDVFVCETVVIGTDGPSEGCSLTTRCGTTGVKEEEKKEDDSGVEPMNLEFALPFRKLRTYTVLRSIPDDEFFLFKTPITMEKDMSPQMKMEGAVPLDSLDELMDDDTDGSESVASSHVQNSAPTPQPPSIKQEHAAPMTPSTPLSGGLILNSMTPQPKIVVKSKSGYILFSAEVRKRIMHENPDAGFGEVSKIVGIEWKKLSDEQKKQYEVRAEVVAQERARQEAAKAAQERTLQPGQIRIYQCKWANCDSQFDNENGLYEHIVQHHTSQIIVDSEQQFVCMWMTCLRNRKDGKPFPSLPRLHRHMKEKHLTTSMRNVYQNQIGRNFFKLAQTTLPSGDQAYQLVNVPYGRVGPPPPQQVQQMNGTNGVQTHHVVQHHPGQMMQQQHPHQHQQMPGTPQTVHHVQQQAHVNGGEQHYAHAGVPHQVHHTPHANTAMYASTPSSSQQYQQVPHHPPQHHPQQVQQVAQVIADPGRTVVRAVQTAEPAFVAPPNSVHSRRVLHSEAYLKYIESLASNRQRSVSRWEKSIGSTHRNGQIGVAAGPQRLPTHWIRECSNGKPAVREDDVTKALWKLRDELLQSTCNVVVERDLNLL